jgi:hypothetical protein
MTIGSLLEALAATIFQRNEILTFRLDLVKAGSTVAARTRDWNAITLKVGLPQCPSEKNDQKGRLHGQPVPSPVPVAAHTARSSGLLARSPEF